MKKLLYKLSTFNSQFSIQQGITLVELIVVMAIFTTLIGLTTINLLGAKQQASLSTSVDTLITDIKEQQVKAMVGDTEGRGNTDKYGIHFETNTYTLFHGTYTPGDSSNSVISLGDSIQFSTVSFPSSQLIFSKGSGEVSGSGSNTIVVQDISNGSTKTITINRYGVVTGIN